MGKKMKGGNWPLVKDLLLIGGGHAHALVLRRFGMAPQPGTRITVIDPHPVAPYTGMLPGHIAGHYLREEIMIDLVSLARFAGARLILDRAEAIDRTTRRVRLRSGRWLRYDVASLDVGITSDLPGFAHHAVAAKPLGPYSRHWQRFLKEAPQAPQIVVIGGGLGGAELAMASAHRLRQSGRQPRITLLEQSAIPLPGVSQATRRILLAALAENGVTLQVNARPVDITANTIRLGDGETLPVDFTLSVAGARAPQWFEETGLALTDGFVTIDATLQSNDPQIFAAGDCAHMNHAPRPKAGVFAVRQAPILNHNLRARLAETGTLRRYKPQRDYLKLISLGTKAAAADRSGLPLRGRWLWHWKNRIDRDFMAKFTNFPAMPPAAIPKGSAAGIGAALGPKPLCGGCGAKLGPEALMQALQNLPPPRRADILSGPGDDAALIAMGGMVQAITTDHLRAFTLDPALMARLAAIHALGDIWAMGAVPQGVLAQITLPRLAEALQADMMAEILGAASEVIRAAGADLVGGHSAIGAELNIGFTITGITGRAVEKSGARAGDALILTKPIGTGAILTAEMATALVPGILLGEAVAGAFASMSRPLGAASAILAPHVNAMTDVTGFGLAGHLLEILRAAGLSADLDLTEVPFLPGAEAVAKAGHESTLMPANRAAALPFIDGVRSGPRMDLLFDPQTCGGLLAALPVNRVDTVLAALNDIGETEARIIGHLHDGPPRLRISGA
ncbi:MAG: selenide, water dikinase SelD [Pseudorhodobacter sp.]